MAKIKDASVMMKFPTQAGMRFKFTLEGELNITPFVAKQKANLYLATEVGNLVMSEEPDLEFQANGAFWRVPSVLTNPVKGRLGKIGEVIINAQDGNIIVEQSTPVEEMIKNAETLDPEGAL